MSNNYNAIERSNASLTAQKLKKFLYLSTYNELLAKCVREHDTHKVEYGKEIETFQAVRRSFIDSTPLIMFDTHDTPSVKSIRDCYIRLKEYGRDTLCEVAPLSRDSETLSDLDVLLDDLIHKKTNLRDKDV